MTNGCATKQGKRSSHPVAHDFAVQLAQQHSKSGSNLNSTHGVRRRPESPRPSGPTTEWSGPAVAPSTRRAIHAAPSPFWKKKKRENTLWKIRFYPVHFSHARLHQWVMVAAVEGSLVPQQKILPRPLCPRRRSCISHRTTSHAKVSVLCRVPLDPKRDTNKIRDNEEKKRENSNRNYPGKLHLYT